MEDEGGGRFKAWGNTTCSMSDEPCFDAMEWVLSATRPTPDSRTLATGDTISTGSLTYYFEVPRASGTLRLRFGEDPPLPLQVADRLGGSSATPTPRTASERARRLR